MTLILYNPKTSKSLLTEIKRSLPQLEVKAFATADELIQHLEKPLVTSAHLAMLVFSGQSDLNLIIQKRHLLADIPSILILPENSPSEALLQAHMLRPRALFSDGGNWQAAIQILVRMYERRLAEHGSPSMVPYENNNILENNG